jgi:CRP-like cAMP-binding protein
LGQFPVFEDLSPDELARVGHFVMERSYPFGSTLFRQGELPDSFYLVENGVVQEVGTDSAGRELIRRRSVVGDCVGHRPLMADEPHRTTATVIQQANLFAIEGDDFRTLLAMFPRLKEPLERTSVVNRLLAIPVFGSFSEEQLFDIADLVRIVEYPAGEVIFHQGKASDAFYVIDTGQIVERATGTVPGKQAWPKYLAAGNFFGRYSLLRNTTRRASAEAATDVRLFRLSADSFHWLRRLDPEFDAALERHDVLGHLRNTRVFAGLSDEELKHLAGFVGLAHFRPSDVLYRQGEIDPTFYVLYEGEAIVRARDEEGRERPRDYLKVGDAVGESSLFLGEPRDVTVEATTKANWFYLTREDLDQFLVQHPELREKVLPREEIQARTALRRLPWMEPDEQLVLRRRRHWFFLTSRLLLPVLLLLLALFVLLRAELPAIAYLLLAAAVMWMIWRVIDWLNDYYVVTTRRVAHREKVLLIRETRDETPLDKIQNVNIATAFVGNLLGYGTLLIDTAATIGASRVVFSYLADPRRVQDLVFEQVSRARAGERVEMRRVIRDQLEGSLGPGIRPAVPRPAVPSPPPPPPRPPSGSGIWDQIGNATWRRWFWMERRTDGEVIWRKHWIRLLLKIWLPLLVLLFLLLTAVVYLVPLEGRSTGAILVWLLLLFLTFAWLWWNWENWGNDKFIVTNDRIIDIEALPLGFSMRRTETTFDRIQNVNFEIPDPIATILNYGTVAIYTAGIVGRLDFVYMRDPKGVQAEIFRRLTAYEAEQRRQQREEQRGELPQWFAVYDETRRT